MARIGAGIDIEPHLAGDDAPVLHHAVLDVDALGGARDETCISSSRAVGIFDRPVGQHRGKEGDRLGDHIDLAAEAAADRAADQAQFLEGRFEDQRRVVEGEE